MTSVARSTGNWLNHASMNRSTERSPSCSSAQSSSCRPRSSRPPSGVRSAVTAKASAPNRARNTAAQDRVILRGRSSTGVSMPGPCGPSLIPTE